MQHADRTILHWLHLRYREGMLVRDIADLYGTTMRTVQGAIWRVRTEDEAIEGRDLLEEYRR